MPRHFIFPTATALTLAATLAHASPLALLYDQSNVPDQVSAGASPTQHAPTFSAQLADDFEVNDSAGWTVSEFIFSIGFTDPDGTDPGQPPYDIYVYPDAGGMPAATAACERPAIPGTYEALPGGAMNVTVPLEVPCVLGEGRYWLQVSPVLAVPYSLWGYKSTAAPILNEPVFRNPDGSYGIGCTDWEVFSACLPNPSGGVPNFQFEVLGSVGQSDLIFSDGFDG